LFQKKQNKIFLFALIVFFTSWQFAVAESIVGTYQLQDEKRQEEEKQRELERLAVPKPTKKWFRIQFGGWESITWRNYTDIDNSKSIEDTLKASLENDLRLWAWLSSFTGYSAYFRLKQSYTSRRTGTGYTGIGDDYSGPILDVGYLMCDINLGKVNFNAKLGRQYFYLGRGIVFSGVNDGGMFKLKPKNFYIKAVAAHSNPADQNLDLSAPDYDKNNSRYYYGLEAAYTGFFPLTLYAYGFGQHDSSKEEPTDPTHQRYLYNSQYLGLGLDGKAKKRLEYWLEFIKEWGVDFKDTAIVPAGGKADIDAWGLDCGSRYTLESFMHPSLEFEYAFGSGNKNRTSVTDTKNGGNRLGKDTNFSYYGYFATGYALASRLSNLSVYKVETTITPFEKIKFAKDIDIGFKYYIYKKAKADGGVYDTQATLDNSDIGNEVDAYLYFKPSEKFYVSTQYGIFFPGKAYPENQNDPTQYLLVRATFVF
jgi:hypothetical protein